MRRVARFLFILAALSSPAAPPAPAREPGLPSPAGARAGHGSSSSRPAKSAAWPISAPLAEAGSALLRRLQGLWGSAPGGVEEPPVLVPAQASSPDPVQPRLVASAPLEALYQRQLGTSLAIPGDDGRTYVLSAQRSRRRARGDRSESTAYLTFHGPGMEKDRPVLVDMKRIEKWYGIIPVGGDVNEVRVGEQTFKIYMKADPQDREPCRTHFKSKIVVESSRRSVTFSVTQAFERTGETGERFRLYSPEFKKEVEVALVHYRDHPANGADGLRSVALMAGGPAYQVEAAWLEWVPADGRVLTTEFLGRKLGLRIAEGNLEVQEFPQGTEGTPLPGEISLEPLVQPGKCPKALELG